ncbi:MAG: sigma-70 family RNA polymerase sigma factor [Oscillospiraceae bacterium]
MENGTEYISQLFSEHGDEILRLCFLYLRNREDAEDAAMEAFSRAVSNADSFRHGSQPRTWLVRIAINVCKDMLKSNARRANQGSDPLENIAANDELVCCEERYAVSSAISSLPLIYREAAVLHFYNGFTIKESAKIAGIPQTTMAFRIKRAKELLRKSLAEWFSDL